jgi:hypothetical protein
MFITCVITNGVPLQNSDSEEDPFSLKMDIRGDEEKLEEYQQFNETKQKIALTISSLAEEDMEALGRSCSELVHMLEDYNQIRGLAERNGMGLSPCELFCSHQFSKGSTLFWGFSSVFKATLPRHMSLP